jgi:MFS family permease
MAELHETSNAVGSLMITSWLHQAPCLYFQLISVVYLMGYALGPLFLAPLSEIYGRYPVIVVSCWCFNAFLIGCSFVNNMPGLIVLRLLAGTGGSAVMAIAPAIVADIYPVERRSFAMGIVLVSSFESRSAGCTDWIIRSFKVSVLRVSFALIIALQNNLLILISRAHLRRLHC